MQTIINDLLSKGNYVDYDVDVICAILQKADDEYTNDGELSSFELSDNEYDIIKFNARRLAPSHIYFTGVGSDVRGGKIDLPNKMPSLEQVEIGDIEKWISDNNLKNEYIIATDKMDGTSIQLIYDEEGELRIAYSRGNGLQGADVTRHVRRMKKVPVKIKATGQTFETRAEVELSNSAFDELKSQVFKSDGKPYKNPRNMTAGMMNKEEAHQEFYDAVDIFFYEWINCNVTSKSETIETLHDGGLKTVTWKCVLGEDLTDEFLADYLEERKENLDYDIDGLVLTVNDGALKRSMDKGITGKSNPKSSVKYKVADASNYALVPVLDVDYQISKDGYANPVIRLEPFDIQGVTVSNTHGFNAKFIKDNMIGKGSILLMTRSGDVIPFVVKVNTHSEEWIQPTDDYEYVWNETGVDLILKDPDSHPEVRLQRVVAFCTSLELPMLKEGSIGKLFAAGIDTIEDILLASKEDLVNAMGKNGEKAWDGIHARLSNVRQYELAGSTPYFGRGVGKRRFEELFASGDWTKEEDGSIDMQQLTHSGIIAVKGFEEKTADKIMEGVARYQAFLDKVGSVITYAKDLDNSSGNLAGAMVVFTGFRDKDLQVQVESAGGKMQSSVNGKTTILVASDPNKSSGKLDKARAKGIVILSPEQIQEKIMVG